MEIKPGDKYKFIAPTSNIFVNNEIYRVELCRNGMACIRDKSGDLQYVGEAWLDIDFDYVTPETLNPSEAVKLDQDKPPMELLSGVAMLRTARVMAFGAKKYAPNNWRKGMAWTRLVGALLRHITAWAGGEDKDPETGLSHLDHAACCVMFLQEYDECGLGTDDRYKGE